jgi:hypothetical protein
MYLNNHDLAKAYQQRLLMDARPEPPSEARREGGRLVLALAGVGAMITTITGIVLALLKPVS